MSASSPMQLERNYPNSFVYILYTILLLHLIFLIYILVNLEILFDEARHSLKTVQIFLESRGRRLSIHHMMVSIVL